MTHQCQRCGVEVTEDTPGASFVIVSSRVLTLEEIEAGVAPPEPEAVYAYCPNHNAYDAIGPLP